MLLVIVVVSFVAAAIAPSKNAFSLHLVEVPAADVAATVGPLIVPMAVDIVVLELTGVLRAVSPPEGACALFLSLDVLAFESCTVRPLLEACARLRVLLPVAGETRAVAMMIVCALPVKLAIAPLALIDISVIVKHAASPTRLALKPEALIQRTVAPEEDPEALSLPSLGIPLADIGSAFFFHVSSRSVLQMSKDDLTVLKQYPVHM